MSRYSCRGPCRRGMALVEVIVVVCVLAIVMGLILMSLARTRAPHGISNRTQNNNNLKQCALAVHNFHDTYRRMPDGFRTGGIYTDQEKSLWFHLLPYVEADNLYKFGKTDGIVPAFTASYEGDDFDQTGRVYFAGNVRIFAFETLRTDLQPVNSPGDAVALTGTTMKSGLTLPRIEDGTTNTILMTTRYGDCAGIRTMYAADLDGSTMPGQKAVGGFMGAGTYTTPPTREGPITAMFQLAPRPRECLPDAGIFGHSFGSGGMSVALADASIKNIAPTMSTTTFTRALCPGDKNKLLSDWEED